MVGANIISLNTPNVKSTAIKTSESDRLLHNASYEAKRAPSLFDAVDRLMHGPSHAWTISCIINIENTATFKNQVTKATTHQQNPPKHLILNRQNSAVIEHYGVECS